MKWEGVYLPVLSALFRVVPDVDLAQVIREKPTGAYSRRLWFLFEWLTNRTLDLPDTGKVKAVLAVNGRALRLQPEGRGVSSQRCHAPADRVVS